jgi:hypothetical protein
MLASERPYRLVDPSKGEAVWKDVYSGELALLAQGGPEEAPPSIFRIQVGAYTTAEAAEQERATLEKTLGVPAVVRYVEDRGSWRVRVGEAKSRAGLAPLLARLRDAGRNLARRGDRSWAAGGDDPVAAAWDSRLTSTTRLLALRRRAPFQVPGKTYRGAIGSTSCLGTPARDQWAEPGVPARGGAFELGPGCASARGVEGPNRRRADVRDRQRRAVDSTASTSAPAHAARPMAVLRRAPALDRAVAETKGRSPGGVDR